MGVGWPDALVGGYLGAPGAAQSQGSNGASGACGHWLGDCAQGAESLQNTGGGRFLLPPTGMPRGGEVCPAYEDVGQSSHMGLYFTVSRISKVAPSTEHRFRETRGLSPALFLPTRDFFFFEPYLKEGICFFESKF